MRVAATRAELAAALGDQRAAVKVALVPTMGALHRGHQALLDDARSRADAVVASIFVNPLQFSPGEDLASYPRSLDADLEVCAAHGVDVAFTPEVATVYPDGEPQVSIDPGPLGAELEGASRPGHFRGMLTVVAKLFGLTRPDAAVFGTKDYQQLTLVRRCVRDLCLPIDIVGVDTVRDEDGLALSSRNRYLSRAERAAARALPLALSAGSAAAADGGEAVLKAAYAVLDAEAGVEVDYLELRNDDLTPLIGDKGPARLLLAARVGRTRLVDNVGILLGLGTSRSP